MADQDKEMQASTTTPSPVNDTVGHTSDGVPCDTANEKSGHNASKGSDSGLVANVKTSMKSALTAISRPLKELLPEDGQTRKPNIPGKPSVDKVFMDSVDISWDGVNDFCEDDVYEVRIEKVQTKSKWHTQSFSINNGKVTGLEPGTTYIFKVRWVMADGESFKYSEKSEAITTQTTFASRLVLTSILIRDNQKGPPIYALPMKENTEARNTSAMTKKFDIGLRGKEEIERTIMLVGATGTGKSTFVDGLANFVLGVRLEDPFRFTVMQDEEDIKKQENQAISQTDWISCYTFNPQPGTRFRYRLNVIDTPGFGDTRGLERDQKIIEQIRKLFEAHGEMGVQTIDAVCFLIKAPDSRMTATQRYIFNAIMSLFGQDIAGNICTLITFADGSDPPVLSAVKASGLPFGETFTFNNSALFSDPCNNFTKMFWDMGLSSFEAVFSHFMKLQSKSLQLTKEVLQERHRLEITAENLQPVINAGLSTLGRIRKEIVLFKENEDEINRNQNFTYEEIEPDIKKVMLPVGIHVTNCLTCNRTCHSSCIYANDEDKKHCSAMRNGLCTQCPKKCSWQLHKNSQYRIEFTEKKVLRTYEYKQKKYRDAQGKLPSFKMVLNNMAEELEVKTIEIAQMMDDMRTCNNRLKEIALRPNPLDMADQIDLMIMAEKEEAKAGFQNRIEVLNKFRMKAAIGDFVNQFKEQSGSIKNEFKVSTCADKTKSKFISNWW